VVVSFAVPEAAPPGAAGGVPVGAPLGAAPLGGAPPGGVPVGAPDARTPCAWPVCAPGFAVCEADPHAASVNATTTLAAAAAMTSIFFVMIATPIDVPAADCRHHGDTSVWRTHGADVAKPWGQRGSYG